MDPRIEVDDVIILLLGGPSSSPLARGRIEGVTRLEKLVFLLERESNVGKLLTEDPDFHPYNFGPFSSKVYQALDSLGAARLVDDSSSLAPSSEDAWEADEVIGTPVSDPYATRNFALTEKGAKYYEALLTLLPQGSEDDLARFKQKFAELPLRRLVRYVYERYPEMTEKSVIRDEVLGS